MTANRVLVVSALLLAAPAILLPVAAAEPACVEVYPYDRLCKGDVVGFLKAFVGCGGCPMPEPAGQPHPVECPQVYPYSRLCQGDVVGFLEHWVGVEAPVLP